MRSTRFTHAVVRDAARMWGRQTEVPTLSEDGTLWKISQSRENSALRFRGRASLKGMARAAARQARSVLGMW